MADTHTNPSNREAGNAMIANTLAIVGSIILIIIIIWGLINLFSLSGGFFGGLFSGDNGKIEVTAPTEMTDGEIARISWKHENDERGTYAIMYACIDGFRFSTPGPNNAFVTMPCGAAFSVGSATMSANLLPMLEGNEAITTPLSVLFIPSSTSTSPVESTVTITVKPSDESSPNTPVATSTTTTPLTPKPKPTTPTYTGNADLAVTITSVAIDQWGNGTVVFHISNIGSNMTGSYYFTAQLPTAQPYTYSSPMQASLSPGSYIVNTLTFTQAIPGNVFVSVDPSNQVRESNETNNQTLQYVTGQYPYSYQNPYQYPRY